MESAEHDGLRGRHIVLAGGGTVEILRTLQAALIDLGCTVFCQFDQEPLAPFDRPVDAVFYLELLDLGVARIDAMRATLDQVNPDAPIFNIALSHPIIRALGLGVGPVETINAYLADRRIITWIMCSESAREFSRFGLVNAVQQPLGIYPHVYLGANEQWVSGIWVNRRSSLTRLDYGEIHQRFFPDIPVGIPVDIKERVFGKILYLGVPNIDHEDRVAVHVGEAIDHLRRNFRPRSKALYAAMLGDEIAPDRAVEFIHFHLDWIVNVPLQRRRLLLGGLLERFGDQISVYGDGWDRHIGRSFATSLDARLFYRHAACCLDFGSLQFDVTYYPRTLEILKCGGLLIAGQSSDTQPADTQTWGSEAWGSEARDTATPENRFQTIEELSFLVEAALDPDARPAMLAAQARATRHLDLGLILPRLLEPYLAPS